MTLPPNDSAQARERVERWMVLATEEEEFFVSDVEADNAVWRIGAEDETPRVLRLVELREGECVVAPRDDATAEKVVAILKHAYAKSVHGDHHKWCAQQILTALAERAE